ncbi:MAG: NAD(P)-dependent oxidoreductase [Polyangiaceae bacterium]
MSAGATVLVTGARGFIGQTLLALAQREGAGHTFVGVDYEDADLRDREATLRLLQRVKPERVVHLAGKLVKGESAEVLREQMEHTFQAGTVLLGAALETGVQHVLIAGTIDEFGSRGGVLSPTDQAEPVSYYGLAKALLREYAAFFARNRGMRIDWFRPFTAYGPGQAAGNMLLPVAFRAAKSGKPAQFTDGSQQRDFIHVADIAGWLLRALEIPLGHGPGALSLHHLGSGHATSVRAVLEAIAAEFPGAQFELGALPRRPGEPSVQIAPAYESAEVSLKGWRPEREWRAGITETALWWKSKDAV